MAVVLCAADQNKLIAGGNHTFTNVAIRIPYSSFDDILHLKRRTDCHGC